MNFKFVLGSVATALLCGQSAVGEPTRSFGTVDSFGLLRWETFSSNARISALVEILAKASCSRSDLRVADDIVALSPKDIPSRALRGEIRLRVFPSKGMTRPDYKDLASMTRENRFEIGYQYYHFRRLSFPEQLGITSSLVKATPPFRETNYNDLDFLVITERTTGLSDCERILALDGAIRYDAFESARKEARRLIKNFPNLWQLQVLQAFALRNGVLHGPWNGKLKVYEDGRADPDRIRRPDLTLALSEKLLRRYPDCRVLEQLAGVAALTIGKEDVARSHFRAYLAKSDPGDQGINRSRDVRELFLLLLV